MSLLRRILRISRPAERVALPSRFQTDLSDYPDLTRRQTFFAQHIFVHTHIPKTAGTSFSNGMQSIVGAIHSADLRWRRSTRLEDMTEDQLDNLHFASGHFSFGKHRQFTRAQLYLAAVRDPVERAISAYRFLRNSPKHPVHPKVKDLSFEECYDLLSPRDGLFSKNLQTQMLTGDKFRPGADINKLWRSLDDAYFLIVPHDRVTKTINAFREAFGVPWAKPVDMNVSKGFETNPAPDLRARILKDNETDAQIVNRATERYERKLQQACAYIAERCLKPLSPEATQTTAH